MKPLEFIAAVVPSTGVLCVAEFSSNKKQHVFANSVAELEPAIKKFSTDKLDVYFALASFTKSGNRTVGNAMFMRSAFLDIDCGEGKAYATKQAAATALDEFLQGSKLGALGNPWVVSSGGGLHVYWPFTEDVPVAKWRPAAEGLKQACKDNNLNIDFTVTADAARVLRVPGTTNWKNKAKPRTVKVLSTGGVFDFAKFCEAVEVTNTAATPPSSNVLAMIPGRRPTLASGKSTHIKLISNTVSKFSNLLDKTKAGNGCQQLKYYIDNAAKDGMEPLWRGLLSIAQKCEDGEEACTWLSELHPYPQSRMQQKLREIKGHYPCAKFNSENLGVCPDCKHWEKLTTPLTLANETAVDNAPKEIVLDPAEDEAPESPTQVKLTRPSPPRGFSYGRNGGVYREVETEDEQKNLIKKQVMVLPYDMFAVDLLNVSGEHTVHMVATRPDGKVDITLPQKAVVSKDDTVKALASQNIIASFGSGNDKNLFDYVRACVEDVSVNRHAIPVPASYGWQPDNGFVAGGKIFMTNGEVRQIPMPGLENITHACKAVGGLDGWRKFVDLLVYKELWDVLMIGAGVGFGSPLMEFSGLDGVTYHAGSSESGTGKTLALNLAASIWGHPRDYRVNKSTSPVAMQQRAGLLKNLPLISDEITSKNRRDFEWFPEFVFDMAEGRAKERMESGANKERVNLSVWATMAIVSSNTHVMDYMTGGRKHASNGEIMRMLEWTTTQKLSWDLHEVDVIKSIRSNYGVAGDIYARWLALNRSAAMTVYEQVYAKIRTEFRMSNDERYWHAGAACKIAGCILAGEKYANVVNIPIKPIIKRCKELIDKSRVIVRSNTRTAEDVLNSYIREFYGKFINIRAIDNKTIEASYGDRGVIDESLTRSEIFGRVERNITPGYVNLYVEESLLKQYCSSMSFGYADLRAQLERAYRVDYVKKDMLSKTKGPQMRVNAIKISRPESDVIDLPLDGKDKDTLSLGEDSAGG